MSIVKQWKAKQFIAYVAGEVAVNMDRACEFAADRARAKVPVRSGLTKSDIDYEVDARALVVEGRIGIPKGKGHAFYGYFVEVGTSKMGARPFLRPAVSENGAEIVRILEGR